jgi:hypothetical protein
MSRGPCLAVDQGVYAVQCLQIGLIFDAGAAQLSAAPLVIHTWLHSPYAIGKLCCEMDAGCVNPRPVSVPKPSTTADVKSRYGPTVDNIASSQLEPGLEPN